MARGGASIALAPRELDLLLALLRADGAALSRRDLLRDVWGHKAEVSSRTVDTHVAELRRKLETEPSRPRHILTVRKFGYRLALEGEGEARPGGFTLVELVVALTIIALIVAVALPAMMDLGSAGDPEELGALRTLLLDARQESERTGSTVDFVLVPHSGRYRVERRRSGGSDLQVVEGSIALSNVRTTDPADRFRVSFRPVGMGVGDSIIAGEEILIVDATTGRIAVERLR